MRIRTILISALLCVFSQLTFAAQVAQLYMATIPVTSETEQDRNIVLPQALQQVLVKLTGNPNVIQLNPISIAVKNADKYLQAYTYNPIILDNGISGLGLTVAFNSKAVNELLIQNGQTLWGNNRPSVLVLLTVQEKNSNNLISGNTANILRNQISQSALQFGLPIQLPNSNSATSPTITVDDLSSNNLAKIRSIGAAYQSDAILIGKATQSGQLWQAKWQLLNGNQQAVWTSQGKLLLPVLKLGLATSAQILAEHYIFTPVAATELQQINITVTNVQNLTDFAKISELLHKIPEVKQVSVVSIDDNAMVINISYVSSIDALAKAISLIHPLHQINNANLANNEWIYQWLP